MVSYKFKVNSSYAETMTLGRGLWQGDPISLYLFLLCAGFSTLLHQAESNGTLRGIRVALTAPTITHLLFADDSLLLFEATTEGASDSNHILQVYEASSIQMVNRDKSSIMFSKNTKVAAKQSVMITLGLQQETTNAKYLGLPMYIGRSVSQCFEFIKDRVWARM